MRLPNFDRPLFSCLCNCLCSNCQIVNCTLIEFDLMLCTKMCGNQYFSCVCVARRAINVFVCLGVHRNICFTFLPVYLPLCCVVYPTLCIVCDLCVCVTVYTRCTSVVSDFHVCACLLEHFNTLAYCNISTVTRLLEHFNTLAYWNISTNTCFPAHLHTSLSLPEHLHICAGFPRHFHIYVCLLEYLLMFVYRTFPHGPVYQNIFMFVAAHFHMVLFTRTFLCSLPHISTCVCLPEHFYVRCRTFPHVSVYQNIFMFITAHFHMCLFTRTFLCSLPHISTCVCLPEHFYVRYRTFPHVSVYQNIFMFVTAHFHMCLFTRTFLFLLPHISTCVCLPEHFSPGVFLAPFLC